MTGVTHSGKHKIFWGCLVAVVLAVILIVVAAISWSAYWYEQDNAARRDPMENLADFHTKLQSYLSAHEGKYPAGQGAEGLGELQVYLPYLRVKDDKVVEINPDIFTERHTSYAYIAFGIRGSNFGGKIIFDGRKECRLFGLHGVLRFGLRLGVVARVTVSHLPILFWHDSAVHHYILLSDWPIQCRSQE